MFSQRELDIIQLEAQALFLETKEELARILQGNRANYMQDEGLEDATEGQEIREQVQLYG